jgi:hypothetical protein
MDKACTFKGVYMAYACPLCGKPKSRSEMGQSVTWIADECVAKGSALSRCDNCGKAFTIPAAVFEDDVLAEVKRVLQLPGDHLYDYVTRTYVNSGAQHSMLKPDWYDILLKANKAGPVDTMAAQWNPGEKCPNCGKAPNSYPISFDYACPSCGAKNSVTQQDIHMSLGVRVLCRSCFEPLLVPSRVWCRKCRRALLDYYDVLRHIADENRVTIDRLDPRTAPAGAEMRNATRNPEPAVRPPDPIRSSAKPAMAETAPVGPVRLRTVGDFLKLIGMRVLFTTRQEKEFEATVRDLSDTGRHILLDDVLRVEYSKVPGDGIVRVASTDSLSRDDLSQHVGKRIRVRMKPAGFAEGILHGTSKPKGTAKGTPEATEDLELTMVIYYHPCEDRSARIDELTFVEVTDRREILF